MSAGGVDDTSFSLGFAAGVVSVLVILPAGTWLILRASETARERLVGKLAHVIDGAMAGAVRGLPPIVGSAVAGVLPIVETATGKRWQALAREKVSVPAGNALLESVNLPAVSALS